MVRSASSRVSNHAYPSGYAWRSHSKGQSVFSEARRAKTGSSDEGEERVTFDDVRKFTLLWPEVEDGTSYGTPALKVRRKLLARLREDNDSLVMFGIPFDEREMLIARQPKLFYFTDHYRDYPIVLLRLSKASRATVEPLLRRHWRTLASKRAVKAYDAEIE
jgi:hypothetical protein